MKTRIYLIALVAMASVTVAQAQAANDGRIDTAGEVRSRSAFDSVHRPSGAAAQGSVLSHAASYVAKDPDPEFQAEEKKSDHEMSICRGC